MRDQSFSRSYFDMRHCQIQPEYGFLIWLQLKPSLEVKLQKDIRDIFPTIL